MIRRTALLVCLLAGAQTLPAQSIRGHYVSKDEPDGVIYHTFPVTLFEREGAGALTFDLTYKTRQDGFVTLNFTCETDSSLPADSVRFAAGDAVLAGRVETLYLEPGKKRWKHRYSLRTDFAQTALFFDEHALPEARVYFAGRPAVYRVRRSAWRTYAPVGYRIFEMIRVNEPR